MVVSSAVELIFHKGCNVRASPRKGNGKKGNLRKSLSKSGGKGKSKDGEGDGKAKGQSNESKGAKGSYNGKTSKTGLSSLEKPEIRDKHRMSEMCTNVSASSFSLGSFALGAMGSPNRFEWA